MKKSIRIGAQISLIILLIAQATILTAAEPPPLPPSLPELNSIKDNKTLSLPQNAKPEEVTPIETNLFNDLEDPTLNSQGLKTEQFIAQEAAFIAENNDDNDEDLFEYSDQDLGLSTYDSIILKRKKEWKIKQLRGEARINNLLHINYKVSNDKFADKIKQNYHDNKHLPQPIYVSNYIDLAFEQAATGNINGLRTLIDNYVSLDVSNKFGNNLLLHSVMAGQLDSVRLLLAKGISVKEKDSDGSTALHIATIKGHHKIIQALLVMGSDPYQKDNFGKSSIDYAKNIQDADIANAFLKINKLN
jgi:hypothetical protein